MGVPRQSGAECAPSAAGGERGGGGSAPSPLQLDPADLADDEEIGGHGDGVEADEDWGALAERIEPFGPGALGSRAWMIQALPKRLDPGAGCPEIIGVEALCKATMDGGEKLVSVRHAVFPIPELGQARGRPQFP